MPRADVIGVVQGGYGSEQRAACFGGCSRALWRDMGSLSDPRVSLLFYSLAETFGRRQWNSRTPSHLSEKSVYRKASVREITSIVTGNGRFVTGSESVNIHDVIFSLKGSDGLCWFEALSQNHIFPPLFHFPISWSLVPSFYGGLIRFQCKMEIWYRSTMYF